MAERTRTVCVAYTKGVNAQRRHRAGSKRPWCPYGATKRELASWWNAGYHDSSKNNVDYNYFKSGEVSTERE